MKTITYLSIDESFLLFNELRIWANSWLLRSGVSSGLAFANWAKSENAFVLRNGPEYTIIITNWHPGLKATIHPLFRDKKVIHNKEYLVEELEEIRQLLGVVRVQLNIGTLASRALRRIANLAGFLYEGTAMYAGMTFGNKYENYEIWAYVVPPKSED